MLLNKIVLNDFRQFKGRQEIVFSEDTARNVTVIMGENGSGKTTFAQAFTWCLYGETTFADPQVISKAALQEMSPGEERTVSVELKLTHKNTVYIITRSQSYQRDLSGQVRRPSHTRLTVQYKDASGQQKFVPEAQTDYRVSEILPRALSGYFFFDGEKIGNMSKNIQAGQSNEFAAAVKGLLGLDTYTAAMAHLGRKKAPGKKTVIGMYNSQYDTKSDSKIGQYTEKIEKLQEELNALLTDKEQLEQELPVIRDEIARLNGIIKSNEQGEEYKKEQAGYEETVKNNNIFIKNSSDKILNSFHQNYAFYFSQPLIKDALEILSVSGQTEPRIPDLHKRTIHFLLKSGVCLCGRPIAEHSPEYDSLTELLEYITKHSHSALISQFTKDCQNYSNKTVDLFEAVQYELTDLTRREHENEVLAENIKAIDDKLSAFKETSKYQKDISRLRDDCTRKEEKLKEVCQNIGAYQQQIDRLETERQNLSLKNESNRKIEIYKAYAERIYDILRDDYDENEAKVRSQLEACINEIFKAIYHGGLSLRIDEKYHVQTIVNDFNDFNIGVETSTAQSISIIFAFIAGVIKMARNNANTATLSTEVYPLVMDAPLSAFDKARIQTVCETLPNIAEQVIIFIKDTDGEIAETYLHDKIGKRYTFRKKNEFETYFETR